MHRGKPGKSLTLPHTEAMPTATAGNGSTLPDLLRAPHERGRIALFLLLLTLTAAWIDMLSYLALGRVFASFMTGNIVVTIAIFALIYPSHQATRSLPRRSTT